jgi:hypothetical protein
MSGMDCIALACHFVDRRCGPLSRAVFVNFELAENAIPSSSKLKIDMLKTSNGLRIRRRRWNISRHLCAIPVSCSANGPPFIFAAEFIRSASSLRLHFCLATFTQ